MQIIHTYEYSLITSDQPQNRFTIARITNNIANIVWRLNPELAVVPDGFVLFVLFVMFVLFVPFVLLSVVFAVVLALMLKEVVTLSSYSPVKVALH